jgi:hypothetical protein
MRRGITPGKAGDGQVETAPEKMDWADLAQKAGAKLFEYRIDQYQGSMKPGRGITIVGTLSIIALEGYPFLKFVGAAVEFGCAAKFLDYLLQLPTEAGYCPDFKCKISPIAMVVCPDESVVDQVQLKLDTHSVVVHNACR